MTPFRATGPLALSLAVALAISLLLTRVDDSAGAARLRQATGLTRGDVVDRNGAVLATTVDVAGKPRRMYTLRSTASTLGFQAPNGAWQGLEGRYATFLSAARARRDWRTFFMNLRGESAEGGTVQLTLDERVQRVADAALGRRRGAVVALDPRSGEVLAMVSKPYCAPDMLLRQEGLQRCKTDPNQPLLNRTTQLLLPPGSSFKIVTLSAALDTHAFSLNSVFSGADAFGPSPYFDNVTYPSNVTRTDLTALTLPQALAFSDNFTFAHIGLTLGAPTLLRYAHRFRVGRSIPFDLPVKKSVVVAGSSHPSPSILAQSSFGAPADEVTPLQMALIASAVANRGVLMAPHLIRALRSASGATVSAFHAHALGRVMSARASREVTTAMMFVVDHGSGFLAQIPGMKVAGKTGTAASGAYFPHAWFISFAPARHPVVAVAVLSEFSGEGFKYAAPAARKVMIAALREQGYHVS